MSYLLYCVFRGGPSPEFEMPTGIHGKPVLVMDHGGLGAAVSAIEQLDPLPDVATVLAYENVVESIFRRHTIIPMRYGCKVRDRMELAALLDERYNECDALLSRLDGLAEMGIQFAANASHAGSTGASTADPETSPHGTVRSGISYLLSKKQYYGDADRMTEQRNQVANAVCKTLSGLFVRHKVELPSRGTHVVSLYFLVPRTSVELFREAGRQCLKDGSMKLVVSGPWPPYNFADLSNISGN